jgi:hypothetical protein
MCFAFNGTNQFSPPKSTSPNYRALIDQIWLRAQNYLTSQHEVQITGVIFDSRSLLQIDNSRCLHISDPNMAANGKNKSSKSAETPV